MECFKKKVRQELYSLTDKFSAKSISGDETKDALSKKFGCDFVLSDWNEEDQEGMVYGSPKQISIPHFSNSDGKVFLVYKKKIFDKAELSLALRILNFYKVHASDEQHLKLVAISNYIPPNTRPFAEQLGVELICVRN